MSVEAQAALHAKAKEEIELHDLGDGVSAISAKEWSAGFSDLREDTTAADIRARGRKSKFRLAFTLINTCRLRY